MCVDGCLVLGWLLFYGNIFVSDNIFGVVSGSNKFITQAGLVVLVTSPLTLQTSVLVFH